jgi:hypothetical protein
MEKKDAFVRYISITVVLLLGILYVAKYGGPSILRLVLSVPDARAAGGGISRQAAFDQHL